MHVDAPPFAIRQVAREDLPQILDWSRQTHLEHVRRSPDNFSDHPDSILWMENLRRRVVEAVEQGSPGHVGYVATHGARLLGFVLMAERAPQTRSERHLRRSADVIEVFVCPSGRGRGIGQALLRRGTEEMLARGCPGVAASVWAGNVASQKMVVAAGLREELRHYAVRNPKPQPPPESPDLRPLLVVCLMVCFGLLVALFVR
ncbi:GNAT family N-acetyltransferase [Phaeovulum sp. W22_SRMD_FR3]|uniref:GNAT family N-acetyltransferase n=1 Tax=Phaeovulum sp. W22_SRMD_FR3 TaxID=3240274 RepID=UPI003F95D169